MTDESGYARELLAGVARHQRQISEPWSLHMIRLRTLELLPPCLRSWSERGNGILGRVDSLDLEEILVQTRLPVVNVSGALAEPCFPSYLQDHESAARLALDLFWSRGFRHFAFAGRSRTHWSLARGAALRSLLVEKGHSMSEIAFAPADVRADRIREAIIAWLSQLPRPLALWACDDEMAVHVLNACRFANIRVPDEVALLGVDNDDAIVDLVSPPLSSVILDGEAAGFRAAQHLHALMSGGITSKRPIIHRLPARGVALRRSTDISAGVDQSVAAALRIIHEEACSGLRVAALVSRLPVSRRVLERRFKADTGRTLLDEIWRVQCQHACHLLETTDLGMMEIAERCGYEHLEHFSTVFTKTIGKRPGLYRKLSRRIDSGLTWGGHRSPA